MIYAILFGLIQEISNQPGRSRLLFFDSIFYLKMINFNHIGIKCVQIQTPFTDEDLSEYTTTIEIEQWGIYEITENGIGLAGGFFRYLRNMDHPRYDELVSIYIRCVVIEVGIEYDALLATFEQRFKHTKKAR